MDFNPPNVLIIGGGISGLTAAYALSESFRKMNRPISITVAEADSRWGGVIHTEIRNGYLIEHGPDSFATDKPDLYQLCLELGLEKELMGVDPACRSIYLRWKKNLYPLPKDFHLMTPARFSTLRSLGFLSTQGKLRMAWELAVPKRKTTDDESLGHFMQRRFGLEALEKIGQPFLGSIFGCDIRDLSLQATFPRFHDMESQHGSILRALRRGAQKNKKKSQASEPPFSPLGMFVTLRSGLSQVVETLRKKTNAQWLTQARAESIESPDGQSWKVYFADGRVVTADILCLAQPAFSSAPLFKNFSSDFHQLLSQQASKSMAVTHAVFSEKDADRIPQAAGFVSSADAVQKIQGASFVSRKFKNRCPEHQAQVRIFPGWQWQETLETLPAETVGKMLTAEFQNFFKMKNPPALIAVSRHLHTLPHYRPGHGDWRRKVAGTQQRLFPNLFLCGSSYQGASLPDCVRLARETAQSILRLIQSPKFISSTSITETHS